MLCGKGLLAGGSPTPIESSAPAPTTGAPPPSLAAAGAAAGAPAAAGAARGGRRALAVELEPGADPAALCVLQSDLAWAELDAVLSLRQIPVDRRHNAKVDYPALYRLLGTA